MTTTTIPGAPQNRPEGTLVSFPKAPPPARRARDPRIDMFRGLALLMILIDHMPGNPYEAVTIRNFGFSDAAEAFFVMSGVAAGIAYSGGVERWQQGQGGLWAAVSPMWNRAWTLYLVQILLTVIALGLFALAADIFLDGRFRTMHNLAKIYTETGDALVGLVILGYQIGYVNILPTYIVLLLVAPLVIAAGLKAPRATLLVALLVWFVAGWMRLDMPNHPGNGGWPFAPTSWQVIFVLGLLIGIRHRKDARLVPVNRPLLWLSAGYLVLALIWMNVPAVASALNHKMAQLGALGAPFHIVSHDKIFVALPRLLHIMAVVYVISCLPMITRAAATRWAAPLRLLGRQGLLVFAVGTVLALMGQIVLRVEPDIAWLPWVVPAVAVAISYAAAWLKDRSRRGPHPQPGVQTVSRDSPMAATARR